MLNNWIVISNRKGGFLNGVIIKGKFIDWKCLNIFKGTES